MAFLSGLGALLPVVARIPLVARDLLLAEVTNLLGRRLVPALTNSSFIQLFNLYQYIQTEMSNGKWQKLAVVRMKLSICVCA